jgi:hypothetical protein
VTTETEIKSGIFFEKGSTSIDGKEIAQRLPYIDYKEGRTSSK